MQSPEADRIAAVNLAYVDYSAEVLASAGWALGKEGTRQPATRDQSIAERHAHDPKSKHNWNRAKLVVAPQLKKVRDAFTADYRTYQYKPRSGTTDKEFFDEVSNKVREKLGVTFSNAVRTFKYMLLTSPELTLPQNAWFVDKAVHDMSIDPQDRPSKQNPSIGRKQQRTMKRSASEAGLDGVLHAPRSSLANAELQEFQLSWNAQAAFIRSFVVKLASKAGIDMSEETAMLTPARIEHSQLEVENECTCLVGCLEEAEATVDDSQPHRDDLCRGDGTTVEEKHSPENAVDVGDAAVGNNVVDTPEANTVSTRARRSHRAPARYGEWASNSFTTG